MEKKILKTDRDDYVSYYSKGEKYNNIALVYYHGLNGKAKIVKPLLSKIKEYDFYSIEERGHENSLQKASVLLSKHDNDILNVVKYLKNEYEKVYLIGESMGALFCSRVAYKSDLIDGVFCWSIPFNPKDIMVERQSKKFVIFFRVVLCFLFGWNYKYSAKVDYPKLTNSPFLMKLNKLDTDTKGSTSEEIAIWKASLTIRHKFLHKTPKKPIYYWHGSQDIMASQKLINTIMKKNKVSVEIIPDAKHILMFEKNAYLIYDKILEIIKY